MAWLYLTEISEVLVCYACELKQWQNAACLLWYPTNDNKPPALSVVPFFSLIEQVGPGAFAIDFNEKIFRC